MKRVMHGQDINVRQREKGRSQTNERSSWCRGKEIQSMQSATIREKGRRNKNLSEEKQHENKSQAPIFSIKQKAAPL